jgi:ATP-dependent DNA helicase RecQ
LTIQEILKKYWNHDSFRPLQENIISAVLAGNDTLALLPTGGGKSICFQVPALSKDGLCLVVSPLIALIKDQVENLTQKGIPALAIYSGMSYQEVRKTLAQAVHGAYKFLYVSPERLETGLFQDFLHGLNINLIAIDEAHCISQWGYDFRPAYLRIATLRTYLKNVPVLALTASATKTVQDDICEKLLFGNTQQRFQQSFERANLSYSVFNPPAKQHKMIEVLQKVKGSAIVYCKSRKQTKTIADLLQLQGIDADYYHAGLSNEERTQKQNNWINNNTRVIACTNAFGMGIDKPDVRVVIHYEIPDCLENYYQEAGRAGRDGNKSFAVLLYAPKDIVNLEAQANIRYPDKVLIQQLYIDLMNFLQIPAGYGEGNSYDFDISKFCEAFKHSILHATYSIKVLEQEALVRFNEVFFKPSTVVFSCDKQTLEEFQIQHPAYETIIKGLLRAYEGIFDYPTNIYETQLSAFIKLSPPNIKEQLIQLHQMGIIHYAIQKETPQIYLLQNRMYSDSFKIDLTHHFKRKAVFEERVKAMVDFVQNTTDCRSILIGNYFNDFLIQACGVCDNCINKKQAIKRKKDFEKISTLIIQILQENNQPIQQLIQLLHPHPENTCIDIIQYLQQEGKIRINRDGMVEGIK